MRRLDIGELVWKGMVIAGGRISLPKSVRKQQSIIQESILLLDFLRQQPEAKKTSV
jgi:hypothetical protein